MNKTEQIVLNIIRSVIFQYEFHGSEVEDWKSIFQELKCQSLLPLTYVWAKKQEDTMDPAVKTAWQQAFAAQTVRWYSMMEEQKKLIRCIEDLGYEIAIMKGSANAPYYPTPQARGCGDIDFLVKWDTYDDLFRLLLDQGYVLQGEKQERKHHVALYKNRVLFEMHKRPGGTHLDGSSEQEELIQFFQAGLDHVKRVDVCGYMVPVLPTCQNGMILLSHMAGHMKEGVGLRHLLDWMLYVRAEVDDEFWNRELGPWAEKVHLDTFAKVLTRTCQKYIGLSENITWCLNAEDELCERLVEYLFYQGDFGSKNWKNDQETKVLTESGSLRGFFVRLNDSSQYSFPLAKKYKVLKPAAWGYQLYRYVRKGVSLKHPLKTFSKSNKEGKERRDFFERIGIM